MMLSDRNKKIAALGIGAILGASLYATIGGMGLVGRFGGVGLRRGAMTGAGAIAAVATLGAMEARKTKDTKALGAIAIGALGGASVSAAVGNLGLAFAGTAVAVGMTPLAVAGGLVGLGIYGLKRGSPVNKIETDEKSQKSSFFDEAALTFDRIEEQIVHRETDLQAASEIDALLAEMRWQQSRAELETPPQPNPPQN